MRFLIDECCPRIVAEALRAAGHDVLYVPEQAPSETDDALALLAQGQERVLVTEDYGFGELAVRRGLLRAGVVLVNAQSIPQAERGARVAAVVEALGVGLSGRLTIIEQDRVRRRAL